MNNVWTVALRHGGFCLKQSPCLTLGLRPAVFRAFSLLPCHTSAVDARKSRYKRSSLRSPSRHLDQDEISQTFGRSRRQFSQSFAVQKLKVYTPQQTEKGLAFQIGGLSSQQLQEIFGQDVPPSRFANRLLRVLHGRRVDGTLDLDPPPDLLEQLQEYPHASADGLQWLRQHFPIDEDEAILRRIGREEAVQEKDSPADLMQRAEDLGLYKPQGGRYQAELSEKADDVFGVSQLEKIRAENIKKAEQEEAELEQQIAQIQKDVKEKSGALATLPENALEPSGELRPPNSFERWVLQAKNRASSKTTLEDLQKENRSKLSRLFPSLLFVCALTFGCYWYSQTWTSPNRADRVWPSLSLTFATILGIIGVNLAIYCLWYFPPAWRLMNKYFISVPGKPQAFSMIGNVFSHVQFSHLAWNMAFLPLFGLSLHEEIGRGNFLALYISAGAIGSFGSMASFTLRNMLTTSALGASGAISGVIAAFFMLHYDETFTIVFLPENWQDYIYYKGWWVFALLLSFEVVGCLSPVKKVDYAGHLAGYLFGGAAAYWWRATQWEGWKRERERLPWFDWALGRKATVDRRGERIAKKEEK